LTLPVVLLLLAGAAPAPPPKVDDTASQGEGEEGVDLLDEEGGTGPAADPAPSPIDAFLGDLSPGKVAEKAESFYASDAVYEDPTGSYTGRSRIAAHLRSLLGEATSLSIEVKEEFVTGDETVALWTASVAHPSLRSGEKITVDGVSHVRFKDGRVAWQRDYYDLGAAAYENVPVVGAVVRWVKGKLAE
jgi:ketosteroid isomerase-like protein